MKCARFIFIMFFSFVCGMALPAHAQKRVALVIGNDSYKTLPKLNNAVKDARDLGAKLNTLGFEVISKTDASRKEIYRAIEEFTAKLKPGDVGLVFYAGHGIQADGRNYLIPSDAQIQDETDLRADAILTSAFSKAMNEAGVSVSMLILDACRDNPLPKRSRSASRGLAVEVTQSVGGSVVLYSAAPGQTAQDGSPGGNGVFTEALLSSIDKPGLTLYQVVQETVQKVIAKTNDRQRPRMDASLTGDFYFKEGKPAERWQNSVSGGAGVDKEAMFWQSIEKSTDASMFEAYLAQYPRGSFAVLARAKVKKYSSSVPAPVTAAQPPAVSIPSYQVASISKTMWVAKNAAVNVRSGPSTNFNKVGRLDGHEQVSVTGDVEGSSWVRVALASGDEGYVLGALLSTLKPQVQVAMSERVEEPKVQSQSRSVGSVFKDCSDCAEMVVMPTGSFRMGNLSGGGKADEKPVHPVKINYSFAVGKYEVTKGQYAAFVRDTGRGSGDGCYVYNGGWEKKSSADWESPGFGQTDRSPVVCVNWDDAQAYVGWLSRKTGKSYRLLSESEWEYVARAGTTTRFSCGNSDNCLNDVAWYGNNSRTQTHSVGQKGANPWGLYDMHGNVFEWVGDCWNGDYNNAPNNGSVNTNRDCSKRVLRGGSWLNGPAFLRSDNRSWDNTDNRNDNVGFRLARNL